MSTSNIYKNYNSEQFVNRIHEIEIITAAINDKDKGVYIVEGDRGSGKTSILIKFYQVASEFDHISPFFISLFPYSAPEIEDSSNVWLKPEEFHEADVSDLLKQLTSYLNLQTVKTTDPAIQKEYLARGLAHRTSSKIPLLIIDSIYECKEDVRKKIEDYILSPLLASEVIIVLSGRGKRPIWSVPELRNPTFIKLDPLKREHVLEQLKLLNSKHIDKLDKILEFSNGYPLIVKILGLTKQEPESELGKAIDSVLRETLPAELDNYSEIRGYIEKLSLISKPFRGIEIEEYLFGNDIRRRSQTDTLIKLLLSSFIVQYIDNGLSINQSIVHPIRQWLKLQINSVLYQNNLSQLKNAMANLSETYPTAKNRYQELANNYMSEIK